MSSAWSKLGKLSQYLQNPKFPFLLRNKCLVYAWYLSLHGFETRNITENMSKNSIKLHTQQWKKNAAWQDYIEILAVKKKTKFPEPMKIIMKQKWKWSGHSAISNDNWTRDLTL